MHASMDHLRACIELAARQEVPDVVLHAFTDGRDTLPDSGAGYLAQAEAWLAEHGGRVASVTGRYYAMDRDKRAERTDAAVDALVRGRPRAATPTAARRRCRAAYERGETDEFIKPTLVGGEGRIRDGDAVVFFNFRPDRARAAHRAAQRGAGPHFTTLTQYREDWDYPVAFPPRGPR